MTPPIVTQASDGLLGLTTAPEIQGLGNTKVLAFGFGLGNGRLPVMSVHPPVGLAVEPFGV